MLLVVMLSVIMLSVTFLIFMLSVLILNVIVLSVVMLSVLAPFKSRFRHFYLFLQTGKLSITKAKPNLTSISSDAKHGEARGADQQLPRGPLQ
jgi:hypothetical protein